MLTSPSTDEAGFRPGPELGDLLSFSELQSHLLIFLSFSICPHIRAAETVGPISGIHFPGLPFDPRGAPITHAYDASHVTMTYTALACLAILGDDFSRVHKCTFLVLSSHASRHDVARALRHFQRPDGSVASLSREGETDMRFAYCACCIATMLDDWSGLDRPGLQRFIMACSTHEGAFAQCPGLEAHAGSTFCAVASLSLMV